MKLKRKPTTVKWLAAMAAALLLPTGCSDSDLEVASQTYATGNESALGRSSYGAGRANVHLIQEENAALGYPTWRATERVPLVGAGRIVDNQNQSLVNVGANDFDGDNIVDLDLTNTAGSFNVVQADVAYNSIVSIRDINHVYSGGQKAGFVCKVNDNGLLSLGLTELYRLETYLKGAKQDDYTISSETNVLGLSVGQINTGSSTTPALIIEGEFEKPFDEIRLGAGGIKADVLKGGLEIYYAYVGENPIIPAVNGSSSALFDGCTLVGRFDGVAASGGDLVDKNLENGIGYAVSLLSPAFGYEVEFGREIPAGSEVGFYITSGEVLDLTLGATFALYTRCNGAKTEDERDKSDIVSLKIAGGAATYFSLTTTVPCTSVKLEIGGVGLLPGTSMTGSVHYAYVREQTAIDPSSYFTMANATVYNPGYRFPKLPDDLEGATVSYEIVGQPGAAEIGTDRDGNPIIWNMNVVGNYVVRGSFSYTDPATNETVTGEQLFTVTRKERDTATCDDAPMTGSAYQADIDGDGWAGLDAAIYSTEGEPRYVVDEEDESCYTYKITKLGLASNKQLIRVTRSDGQMIAPATENVDGKEVTKPIRVGFEVVMEQDILKANVLNFLRIETYKTSGRWPDVTYEKADGGVASGAVTVNLITLDDDEKRTRLYLETTEAFNAIALYYTGLLALDVAKELKIYKAFYIQDAQACANAGEECTQLITNANLHAKVSYESEGLLNLANYAYNMGNIVDGDMASCGTIMTIGDVAGGRFLRVKFDPVRVDQEVGFVLKNDVNVLNLIDVFQLGAYYQGNGVLKTTSGGALDVKLIERGDFLYVSITPTSYTVDAQGNRVESPYQFIDEVRLTWGAGVDLGSGVNVCGVYMRPDIDGDGIMDCLQDEVDHSYKFLEIGGSDYCYGDYREITATGLQDGEYRLKLSNLTTGAVSWYSVSIDSKSRLVAQADGEQRQALDRYKEEIGTGNFSFGLYSVARGADGTEVLAPAITGSEATNDLFCSVSIHPLQTTWTGSEGSDWDNWSNWTAGVPWSCTDVVLPAPQKLAGIASQGYPRLTHGNDYRCNNIHLEAGAQLVGSEFLNHGGDVWVDKLLTGNRYQLVSAPLQGMVTGDMFVAAASSAWAIGGEFAGSAGSYSWSRYDNYFEPLTAANYIEQRTAPAIYQRHWSQPVSNEFATRATDGNDDVLLTQTDWSRTFNHVAQPYEEAQGFALKPIYDGDNTLHFPKSHQAYHYYNIDGGRVVGENAAVKEKHAKGGLFWADYAELNGKSRNSFFLSRKVSAGELYLFGNPWVAYIRIDDFLEGNPQVAKLMRYNGSRYVTYLRDGGVEVAGEPLWIAPMEAVVIEIAGAEAEQYSVVTVSGDMLDQSVGEVPQSAADSKALYLSAFLPSSGQAAECVVATGGSDGYRQEEDGCLLLGSEEPSEVALYTVADRRALSLNRTSGGSPVAIGLRLARGGDIVLTTRAADTQWAGWHLHDRLTGERHPLNQSVTLHNAESGTGRLYLEK